MGVGSQQLAKNADLALPTVTSAAADFSRLHLQFSRDVTGQDAQALPRFVIVINSRGFLAVRKHFISLFLESAPPPSKRYRL